MPGLAFARNPYLSPLRLSRPLPLILQQPPPTVMALARPSHKVQSFSLGKAQTKKLQLLATICVDFSKSKCKATTQMLLSIMCLVPQSPCILKEIKNKTTTQQGRHRPSISSRIPCLETPPVHMFWKGINTTKSFPHPESNDRHITAQNWPGVISHLVMLPRSGLGISCLRNLSPPPS